MRYYGKYTVGSTICAGLGCLIYVVFTLIEDHPGIATFFIPWGSGLFFFCLIFYWLFLDMIYEKFAYVFAPKQFVINSTTLRNDKCSVILTPGQKIVVMENYFNTKNTKRMFSATRKDIKVAKTWYRVCKMFDETSSFDNLETYFSLDMYVNVIAYDSKPAKKENIEPPAINSRQSVENTAETKSVQQVQDTGVEVSVKIDINSATAEEIASLPSINVIMAKKLVEYRNLNGLFKSDVEFLEAAGVKNIFSDKIKTMIIIGKPQSTIDEDNNSQDRIVDF